MRVINNPTIQGREPLQPLPAMQRPLTPPQTQRQTPKFTNIVKSSPKKDGNLQVATREEVNLYDDNDYDDDNGVGASTTVKMSDRGGARQQDPSHLSSWQMANGATPKLIVQTRVPSSQSTAPLQPRYLKPEVPPRSSATSSTAVSPSSVVHSERPAEPKNKPKQRACDILDDILLPALDEVPLMFLVLTRVVFPVSCRQRVN
jgi:hypothetical protein